MPDTPTFPLDPCRFSLLCKNSVLFVRSIYLFWFSLSLSLHVLGSVSKATNPILHTKDA